MGTLSKWRDRAGTFGPNFWVQFSYYQLREDTTSVVKFLLFLILLVLCWPLALVALVLYPLIWLLLLPFRLVGIAVTGVLELIRALFLFPARVLGGRP